MGQSTDAILFYGFHFEEMELEEPEEGNEKNWRYDWEKAYAAARGVSEPPGEFNSLAYSDYLDKRRPLLAEAKGTVGTHCSGDFPMYYVAIKESTVTANRGYPQEIRSLEVEPEWRDQLEQFCKLLNIPWKEPSWWIASYWG